MKTNMKRLVILAALLILFALLTVLSACSDRSIYALDYALEDGIYSDQTEGQTAEATTGAEEEASSPAPAAESEPAPESEPIDAPPESEPAIDTDEPAELESSAEPEATETPELAHYTVLVLNAYGEAMEHVRVKLEMDGELLYSAVTDADGLVSWLLPTGHAYRATASADGYREESNGSRVSDLIASETSSIILAQIEEDTEADSEPTETPAPVPTAPAGIVTILAAHVDVMAGDSAFSLLDGVSARTEAGADVAVWVVDEGGFDAGIAGEYCIIYGAMQDGSLITATRTVTIVGEAEEAAVEEAEQLSAPAGSSTARYEILLAYRNEIYDALTAKMGELNKRYQDKVISLAAQETGARILAQSSKEIDTDQADSESVEFDQVEEVKVRNWSDVLATYIAMNSLDVENPLDLAKLRKISLDRLDEVFWQMNQVNVIRVDGVTNIILYSKNYEEMAKEYEMGRTQRDLLYELMQPEFQRTFASLTGNIAFVDAKNADIERIRAALPKDLSVERKEIVETAFSLVGKVTYLWGGKYNKLGWNDRWGLPCRVTTERNGESVVVEKTGGLDCSGFVSWVFINATGDTNVIKAIGNGSSNQWAHATAVGWDQGRPGDLAFYSVPGEKQFNHVGIIVSVDDDGSYLVAHCSARKNGVVITEAWSTGFRYIRRPILLTAAGEN